MCKCRFFQNDKERFRMVYSQLISQLQNSNYLICGYKDEYIYRHRDFISLRSSADSLQNCSSAMSNCQQPTKSINLPNRSPMQKLF